MKIKYCNVFLLGVIVLIFFFACQSSEQRADAVAIVDGLVIDRAEFVAYFKSRRPGVDPDTVDIADKQRVLQEMIDQQLIYAQGLRLGYESDPEVREFVESRKRALAARALRHREVENKVITDDLVKQYYDLSDSKLRLLRMKFPIESDSSAAAAQADSIYRLLQQGDDFKTLAVRYSKHKNAASDSGKIMVVDCYQLELDLFARGHSLQTGQFTAPFYSNGAIYLLQLQERQSMPRPPFETARAEIREKLEGYLQPQISGRFRTFYQALNEKHRLTIDSETLAFFCKRCATLKNVSDSLDLFSTSERKRLLSTNDVETVSIGEFLPKVYTYYWRSLNQEKLVRSLLQDYSYNRLLKHEAMQQGLDRLPEVRAETDRWLVHKIKDKVQNDEIRMKMVPPDEELRNFYRRNISDFTKKEQAVVRELFCKSRQEIENFAERVASGEEFRDLVVRYCQHQGNRDTEGLVGPFPRGMNGKLGELAFSLPIGAISDPFPYRGGFSMIQVIERIPAREKPYEETAQEVRDRYWREHREQLTRRYIDRIQSDHEVKILL